MSELLNPAQHVMRTIKPLRMHSAAVIHIIGTRAISISPTHRNRVAHVVVHGGCVEGPVARALPGSFCEH